MIFFNYLFYVLEEWSKFKMAALWNPESCVHATIEAFLAISYFLN